MRLVLTFLLTVTLIMKGYCQDIHDLNNSLIVPCSWKKELTIDTTFSAFFNEGKLGYITLTSGERFVKLLIFAKEVRNNPSFQKENFDNDVSSSCKNYDSINPCIIGSFVTTGYLIVPELCPNCNFDNDKKCKKLSKAICKWIRLNLLL